MRYVVTGGAGFIGSHLVECLLNEGNEVVVLDNFNDFYDPAIKRANLKTAKKSPLFSLVEGDICDEKVVDQVLGHGYVDSLIHLAARAGVRPSIQEPSLYYKVNCEGTVRLFDACRTHGIKQIIFASSSSVYGANTKVPFSETDFVDNPVSPYAATKKAGELIAHAYSHLYDLDITCLRFFTVYGPRQRPEMAIHRFIDGIENERPIPMFGDGTSSRDYTYVADIIQGVLSALKCFGGYRVYNLGNSNPVVLRTLIDLIGTTVGKEPIIEKHAFQPGDVESTFADIAKARDELAYEPEIDIEEGIRQMVAWYRDIVDITH